MCKHAGQLSTSGAPGEGGVVHRVASLARGAREVGLALPGRQFCICHVKKINNKSVKCDCKEEAWAWSFGFLCVVSFVLVTSVWLGWEWAGEGGFSEGSTPAMRGS